MIEKDFAGLSPIQGTKTAVSVKVPVVGIAPPNLSARTIADNRAGFLQILAATTAKGRAAGLSATEIVGILKTTGASSDDIKAAVPGLTVDSRGVLGFK